MYRKGILRSISHSIFFKATTLFVAIEMLIQIINPPMLLALTSGPTQPEVESFQPIGVTDMVDPFTGDFSYNIPLMNVGDYPLNLAYQSGVTMDEEASWTGLGWNVHTGAITRQMRGLPDDFWGDEVTRRVYLRDNLTVGAKVMLGFETFGANPETFGANLGVGFDLNYNTYKGMGLTSMADASISAQSGSSGMNLGLSMAAGPDGLNVSPNISFSGNFGGNEKKSAGSASLGFGFNINSRAGLSGMTISRGVSLNGTKGSRKNTKEKTFKDKSGSHSVASHSSSISLGQPTFTPQIDLPMINSAGSGRFKIGGGVFGQDIDVAITGYGSKQKLAKNELKNSAYGYMYSEKGNGNLDALHDFNREKDGTFTKEKKNLPLTNYTYDIYSISAQGVGGTFRAYRNDAGYVYDKRASSPSTSIDFGVEIGPGNTIDFGLDFNANILESESKAWTHGNAAAQSLTFKSKEANKIKENFHFKLTGEQNIDSDPAFHSSLRSKTPVRFDLDTDAHNYEVPAYNKFVEPNNSKHAFSQPERTNRQYRNTAVYHFTVNEILKAYPWKAKRISPHAKGHHIAEITVIQPDGKRYIFGLAAYNTIQREMSFNVGSGGATGPLSFDNQTGLVSNANQSSIAPGAKRGVDHFYDETVTPAYAHTWMLTEILSPDYVDVTGDGPTPDDLGTYTKFNYGNDNIADVPNFQWRTPTTGGPSASYMEGLKTDYTDDKGSIIYGQKDVWYVQSIESKTQIAVFHTSTREDALGASIDGVLQSSPAQKLRKLDAISLYSKQEYDQSNHTPIPIKTAHFQYDYSLCPGTYNSIGGPGNGKLTLRKVYFTYKNSLASRFSPYEFEYREQSETSRQPFSYRYGQVDRWGVPRPNSALPGGLTHADWPYATQDKAIRDDYSAAWHLNKIKLPSGGQINVKYESDDYGFVQDKAAMRMYKIKGLATSPTSAPDNSIFPFPLGEYRDYVILDLPDTSIHNSQDFRTKYLTGYGKGNLNNNAVKHLYFRFMINVNGLYNPHIPLNPTPEPEYEYVSGYVEPDLNGSGYNPSNQQAYIKIKRVSAKMSGIWTNVSPFAYSAWQFSRLNTPRKAFDQPEPTDDVMDQIIQTLASANMAAQIISFFQGPNGSMYAKGLGSTIKPSGSWVRLMEPNKTKLGGGNRVKEITISNEWNNISGQEPTSTYGQEFSYTDNDGYSSGVAAYEPGVGADENPWRIPSYYSGPKQILIPDERFYMEEPFGESFFPGPSVGYSKVTIKDKVFDENVTMNRTGKTVHEFYTSYDYPTTYTQTGLEIQPREENVILQLISPLKRKYMTASQGYTVTLNDMHGKPKSVSMYAQGESAPFSATKYHYKTLNGKLDNTVDVIDRDGKVHEATIGVETDFIADMREQSTTSENVAANGNLATFLVPPPPSPLMAPLSIPTIFASVKVEKTRYRSATTTKVVQQFGVQDVTETYDKGAYVQTRITAYDARTGAPLVQELNNEYKDKYYKLDYPAHWAYTGMAAASENIGYIFHYSGSGALNQAQHAPLEPGDEVMLLGEVVTGRGKPNTVGNANTARFWVAQDDTESGNKYLINHLGRKVSLPVGAYFSVIRSGHRNMQSTSLGSVTSVASPIRTSGSDKKVIVDASSKVIASNALEFSERWKTERGLQKGTNGSGMVITYSQNVIDYIAILNEMIDRGVLHRTGTEDSESIDHIQFPEIPRLFRDCNFSVCDTVGYFSHTNPNIHPDLFDNGDFPAPWNGSGYQVNPLETSMYPVHVCDFDHHQQCFCKAVTITPLDDAGTFLSTDWDNILYFETAYPLTSSPFTLPQLLQITSYAPVIKAVFPGGVKKDVILQTGCWPYTRTVVEDIWVDYDCEYAAGDTINPYLYGILGNWRAKGDYFYMGDRNKVSASTTENLRNDGYLPNFKAYWKAPASTTEVWARNTPAISLGDYENWNWKTEMTLYSPYGFDIENINALPAYSSAQYGYYNTLPTAVANNAKQKEIGFDGFEDYYPWIEQPTCTKSHFGFEDFKDKVTQDQSHTGLWSMRVPNTEHLTKTVPLTPPYQIPNPRKVPYVLVQNDLLGGFSPDSAKSQKFVLSFWAKPATRSHTVFDYTGITPEVNMGSGTIVVPGSLKKSKLINDWQRYELYFEVPASTGPANLTMDIENTTGQNVYIDDIRVHPFDANIKTFVYHMFDFKYMAQLDENNFATFYEYDAEGKLVRIKKETERGIMTLQENRSNMYKR